MHLMEKVMEYAVLAAGQGSRLLREGEKSSKPMISILGKPMIERLIRLLVDCGAERVHIVTNPAMDDLNTHLAYLRDTEGLPINFRPIISDNSFYSLSEAARDIKGKFIAMTVDAIFPTAEFREYVKAVESMPEGEAIMALTRYVDDESPLYARLNDAGDEVIDYRYGGEPFPGEPIVSAGIYGISDEIMKIAQEEQYPASTSDFQRILAVGDRVKVVPFEFSKAFDVDHVSDRIAAEEFLAEVNK